MEHMKAMKKLQEERNPSHLIYSGPVKKFILDVLFDSFVTREGEGHCQRFTARAVNKPGVTREFDIVDVAQGEEAEKMFHITDPKEMGPVRGMRYELICQGDRCKEDVPLKVYQVKYRPLKVQSGTLLADAADDEEKFTIAFYNTLIREDDTITIHTAKGTRTEAMAKAKKGDKIICPNHWDYEKKATWHAILADIAPPEEPKKEDDSAATTTTPAATGGNTTTGDAAVPVATTT